ncbi:MAG TPA: hypothetical protein PK695_02600, partial [Chitinophagaceae bacterium]|nr:hypothetical protein [Chitinophagaceae bacterium]
ATRMSTLRGWVLDTFNFCYQNAAPMGLGVLCHEFLLPKCRPDGATIMTPLQGYQTAVPMGLRD